MKNDTHKIIITRASNGVLIQAQDQSGVQTYSSVETDAMEILVNVANALAISANIKAEWCKGAVR